MMHRSFLFVLFLLIASRALSQSPKVSYFFTPDTTKVEGLSFTISYTSRLSIINDQAVGIRGFHSGIKFGKLRHRLTVAYFWSNTDPDVQLVNFGSDAKNLLNLDGYLKKDFHYYNLMFYPNWVNTFRWRLSTPVELGMGTVGEQGVFFTQELKPFSKDRFFVPLQVGAYAEYKLSRYIGVNFELGYRFILQEKNIPFELNGIYYGLGGSLYTGALWRDFKRWRKD